MKLSQLIDDLQSVGRVVGFDAPVHMDGVLDPAEFRVHGHAGTCLLRLDGIDLSDDDEEECSECDGFASRLAEAERTVEQFEKHTRMLRKAIDREAPMDDINDVCELLEGV